VSVSPIRMALGAHLGQVLTPEVAAAIELAAGIPTSGPRHVFPDFGSVKAGDYTIRVERFEDILFEIHPLHLMHWEETEVHRHGLALNPDYDNLIARERAGGLLQFTVRAEDGTLVGNLRLYLATSTHTQTRYASEDTVYIHPQHRGGYTVITLLRFAETCLLALGIREARFTTKLSKNVDVLMRRAGYQPVATEFVKFLKE
jgi:hypothetical protein